MRPVKDTVRALVRIGYDGRVHKIFRGHMAKERFENEVRVLKYLEEKGCNFVPKVLEADPEQLLLVTTNCGQRVEHLGEVRRKELFAELETFGVRHDDPAVRNVTYRGSDGRFCLIDFEFATILEHPEFALPPPAPDAW
jgi:tRNA A-37 threonylcarbamoyl transferase component Bud32